MAYKPPLGTVMPFETLLAHLPQPSPEARVAQLVEQRTENPCVGGSIPPPGTTTS